MSTAAPRVGLLATHPVQYYCPWYRALAACVDLEVFFSHQQTAAGQAAAGYGVGFEWDVPLLDGYRSRFLRNVASKPSVDTFWGCNTPELPALIQAGRFDAFIVHGWSTYSYWQAMLTCRRLGIPLLVRGDSSLSTPRAWWWRTIKTPIFRTFISRFDGYLVVGSRARDYVLHYGADPSRCFDAPHCVDNQFFASRSAQLDRAAVRREFGIPDGAMAVLFAGRFVDRKRPELFASAVTQARRRADVFGLMVGDGPLRGAIEADALRTGAPLGFAGFLNQTAMVRAYTAADVLVVPSTWETWGLVVNEAMACGVPAIVTDGVACAGDLVIAGQTGEVFPVDDEAALTEHLIRLASAPGIRTRLSSGALSRVADFDVTVTAEATARAVRAVIARRAAGLAAHTAESDASPQRR